MTEQATAYQTKFDVSTNDRVTVPSRPDLGTGEVLRVAEVAGIYQADVVFDTTEGRKLETIPVRWGWAKQLKWEWPFVS